MFVFYVCSRNRLRLETVEVIPKITTEVVTRVIAMRGVVVTGVSSRISIGTYIVYAVVVLISLAFTVC